jgi:hypothetical protein
LTEGFFRWNFYIKKLKKNLKIIRNV